MGKNAFSAKKKHFLAERKNSRFSVILAQTGSVVILGYFFYGPDVSIKFCWKRSKIKGTYTIDWGMAQNRGEPQKMTHCSKKELFFGVVWMGKL